MLSAVWALPYCADKRLVLYYWMEDKGSLVRAHLIGWL